MVSHSADPYSGHIAMRDCAACSTCNSKETLSPSVDHCCGPTVRHEWRRCLPSQTTAVVRLQGMSGDAGLPPQTTAVVRLQGMSGDAGLPPQTTAVVRLQGLIKEMLSPSADHCALSWTQIT